MRTSLCGVAKKIDYGSDEPLSDENFRNICSLVEQSCGIHITAKKKTLVEGRMRRRIREFGHASLNTYSEYLLSCDAGDTELIAFIDAVTTNKTDFFREPKHFDFLRRELLPRFVETGRRTIKLWSAASSTGAEAYTMAMEADAYLSSVPGVDYAILATDICHEVLAKGVAAIFPENMIDPIPEEFRRRYVLVAKDRSRHEFRITPQLRRKVTFERLNLIDSSYPFDQDFDVIFLRNVLIYFDRATQTRVLNRLSRHLRRGGYLFLGHSETLAGSGLPLQQVASTIFIRR